MTKTEARAALDAERGISNPYGFDSFTATGIAEGFIDCDDEDQVIAAWQYLHDTRIAYSLQGFFGRTCRDLLEAGLIH